MTEVALLVFGATLAGAFGLWLLPMRRRMARRVIHINDTLRSVSAGFDLICVGPTDGASFVRLQGAFGELAVVIAVNLLADHEGPSVARLCARIAIPRTRAWISIRHRTLGRLGASADLAAERTFARVMHGTAAKELPIDFRVALLDLMRASASFDVFGSSFTVEARRAGGSGFELWSGMQDDVPVGENLSNWLERLRRVCVLWPRTSTA